MPPAVTSLHRRFLRIRKNTPVLRFARHDVGRLSHALRNVAQAVFDVANTPHRKPPVLPSCLYPSHWGVQEYMVAEVTGGSEGWEEVLKIFTDKSFLVFAPRFE